VREAASIDDETSTGFAAKGPRDDRRASATAQRTCALTRRERPISDLIRFVSGPGDRIYLDLSRKLPGRGVWITADHASIAAAVKSGAFARSLKRKVSVSPDLADETEAQLRRRLAQAVSLANKAGLLVTGFDKVNAAIERGEAAVLLHGSNAAAGGRQKLDAKSRAISRAGEEQALIVDCMTIDELSLAIGRPNVVHAALKAGGATERFAQEAVRLARFNRGMEAAEEIDVYDRQADGSPLREPSDGEAPS